MRILLVDDDQMVRAVCSNMLQLMGHEVYPAVSGLDAIARLTADPLLFDLVLLDDSMPEMDGLATLQQIQELGLSLRIVIISGGNTSIERYHVAEHVRPLGILSKPFSLQRLSDALNLARTNPSS
ncbi:MAG: response regulator [Planctomycetota bacterium]